MRSYPDVSNEKNYQADVNRSRATGHGINTMEICSGKKGHQNIFKVPIAAI